MEPRVANRTGAATNSPVAMPAVTPPRPADPLWNMLSLAGVALSILDADGVVVWCNPQFADLADRQPTQMLGRSIGDALGSDRTERLRATLAGVARGEGLLQRYEVETSDWAGTRRLLALSASVTTTWDGEPRVAVVAENLTAERRRSAGPTDDGRPVGDPLLGLPDRTALEGLLGTSLRRSVRKMSPLAVFVLDVDGVQDAGRRIGAAGSDDVLRRMTRHLLAVLRQQDVLARVRTDQFVVVAEEVGDLATGQQLAARLASVVGTPVPVDGAAISLSASIGFTLGGGHERPADLLTEAETAASFAQRLGGGRAVAYAELPST